MIINQISVIWERQKIFKTGLSKDAVENIVKKKSEEIYPGKSDYYKVVKMIGVNFPASLRLACAVWLGKMLLC